MSATAVIAVLAVVLVTSLALQEWEARRTMRAFSEPDYISEARHLADPPEPLYDDCYEAMPKRKGEKK